MRRGVRIRRTATLAVVPVVLAVAAACAGRDGAGRATSPSTSTTAAAHDAGRHDHTDHTGHRDPPTTAGGADEEPGTGAHAGHDATLPPLASRLEDATPEARVAAERLLARTRATLAAFRSEPAARAAGYVPNDVTKRVIHYHSPANRRDRRELDPTHPEGLVYFRRADGELRLLGAVYTVWPGEPAPTPGGPIFSWHTHNPSCGTFLVPAGACGDTFRMLHIWTAPRATDPWIQPIQQALGWDRPTTTTTSEPAPSA